MEQASADEPSAEAPAQSGAPLATRLLFAPVHLATRQLAPRLSAQLFQGVWRVVDDSDPPPSAEERQPSVARLTIALALQGACAAVVRGLLEQGSRRQFARLTGRWPTKPPKH